MKSTLSLFAIVLFLSACSGSMTEVEEAEYQNFVAASKAAIKESNLSPKERVELQDRTYQQSGLQDFMFNGESKRIEDLSMFYNDVIKRQYAGHTAQDNLKARFIEYAVNSLDLTNPENEAESQFLVLMTGELMQVNQTINPRLIQDCLTACKDRMENEEYYQMVKNGKFRIRMSIDDASQVLSQRDQSAPAEAYREIEQSINLWQQMLANVDALTKQ